ncbi:MAG TPA: pantoate--beta-alanine ligase, partial [Leptospiraceae bacterium]|nr:pantoate--beta-alanine ligase [Leptospiraceae bacterium]
MKVVRKISELREAVPKGKKNGFVPTMGFLHEGHMTLVREARKKSDIVVLSLFVNPAQFNSREDYDNYPRNEARDLELCKKNGVDTVYIPDPDEIYIGGKIPDISIRIPHLMKNLCATARPGHFEGVLLVIGKLFHAVRPDIVFLGKKDYQQYLIIKEFTEVLNFPAEIVGVETVREKSGLAMSSRNARLSEKGLEAATLLYRSMILAEKLLRQGRAGIRELREQIRDVILSSPLTKIDYIELLDPDTLEEKTLAEGKIFIGLAVFVENVRLI